MRSPGPNEAAPEIISRSIALLERLRERLLRREQACAAQIAAAAPCRRAGARNLAHYLALREQDLRPLQETLACLGISSLGRSEPDVLASVDQVLWVLRRLRDGEVAGAAVALPRPRGRGRFRLLHHARGLLGPASAGRAARIMVTMPAAAAGDLALVRAMLAAGMQVARINCAHDDAQTWEAIAENVRRAAQLEARPLRILMDLAGPKLRTGRMPRGPAVLKLKPARDGFGRVTAPARVLLRATGTTAPADPALPWLEVDAGWLAQLEPGECIDLRDARDARRQLRLVSLGASGAICETGQTAYLVPGTILLRRRGAQPVRGTPIRALPPRAGSVLLHPGDRLLLTREDAAAPGSPLPACADGMHPMHAVSCTLPEVFEDIRPGERIWFDDGRIGGIVRRATVEGLAVEITHARAEGEVLREDKGINLPDSRLRLPALTRHDLAALPTVARLADMVGLSFVQDAADVATLRASLAAAGAPRMGILLKIETRRAFGNLPSLMWAAMAGPHAGVMIARGDLAVECGYERLAEVQEEILWAAEAAHMPVVWATQVLESLARTGRPSRAEVTDAAMGERAECVMLNKGPHIVEAIRTLDDILARMQSHQAKKRTLLRALGAWTGSNRAGQAPAGLNKPG